MLIGMMPFAAFAAGATDLEMNMSVSSATSMPGETVQVTVNIADNPGLASLKFNVEYDACLTLTNVEFNSAYGTMITAPTPYNNPQPITMISPLVDSKANGVFATLTFAVSESAGDGYAADVNITYDQRDVFNGGDEPVAINATGGQIFIFRGIPGDINADKKVNTKDAVALFRYVASWPIDIDHNALDVNGDGTINTKDAITLFRYVAGWEGIVLYRGAGDHHVHSLEAFEASDASCEASGNIAYWACTECGKYYKDDAGNEEITYADAIIPAIGHSEVVDAAVAPTYTSTGLTEGTHCSVCGKVIVAQEVVPMLEANYHSITYRNLNGATSPQPSQYAEHEGLSEMPEPEVPGYKFLGWYTASSGGEVVDYITPGSTKDYILYARWETITYHIYYHANENTIEPPEHSNPDTYTVEDRIILSEATWSGLSFMGWSDDNGKIYAEIPKGTTGDLDLTANWKLMRNIATPGTNTLMLAKFYPESGLYAFIYELGTIEHVVLEELNEKAPNTFYHTGAGDFTLSVEQTLEMSEEVATSITKTISRSVSSSEEWEEAKEWAQERSDEHSTNASISLEIGQDAWPVKTTIEAGYGYANTSTESWGNSTSQGGSYGEETENGEETGSELAYAETLSTTTSSSITIPKDSPNGYYSYAHVGNIRVFGVVTYNPADGKVYLNTYSILDNMHDMLLYYPDINSMNHPTCETLEYKIPTDKIDEDLDKSYYVKYDANGGTGKMCNTLHTIGGEEQLLENEFVRPGYIFSGWEERYETGEAAGTVKSTYTDGQVVNNIAEKGELVTLYAMWTPIDYTVKYDVNKPTTMSQMQRVPEDTPCKFDADVTLAKAPLLPGYTFQGWYITTEGEEEDQTVTVKLGDGGQTFERANFVSEHNGVLTLTAQWKANDYTVTLDAAGGTLKNNKTVVTFDKAYGDLPVPEYTDHVFLGWFTADNTPVTSVTSVTTAEDHTLYAKWLKTRATIMYRDDTYQPNEKDVRINDDDAFYNEAYDPGFDKAALLGKGYKKIVINYTFWLKEINQGNQHMRLEAYYDYTVPFWEKKFNSTPSGWTSYSGTIEIDLNSQYISDTCKFFVGWDAYGNGDDDYWLGDTTFTVTAIK